MHKSTNLEIVRSTMAKFGIKKIKNVTVDFYDINSIYIEGFLTSTELYALSSMVSKFDLEADGSLEPFSVCIKGDRCDRYSKRNTKNSN